MFLYHMRVFAPLPGHVALVFDYGYFGVTFFFVLSGFVLTWSARPHVPLLTFYWRRFARIWPAHMVALLLAIPVFYTLAPVTTDSNFPKPFDLGILLLSVLLIQAWWSNPTILFSGNPAAWTLTVEALFYALHPWISRALMPRVKRGALVFAGATILIAILYRFCVVAMPDSWLASVPLPIIRVPEFVLGMALAWAMRNGWMPRICPFIGVGSMGLVLVIIAFGPRVLAGTPLGAIGAFGNELFTIACGLAIVSLASAAVRKRRRSFFAWPVQVKLGEWSFAFYLVHATFIYLALRLFGYQEASWWNLVWFAVLLAVDLIAAWALYSFVERPTERRMRRWKDNRDKARVVPRSVV